MSKFIYLYRGPATPMEDFTPEQAAEQMAPGPTGWSGRTRAGRRSCTRSAPGPRWPTTAPPRAPADQNGYSIVEADSLDAAQSLTEKHPFLTEGKGRFAVEVFELAPM